MNTTTWKAIGKLVFNGISTAVAIYNAKKMYDEVKEATDAKIEESVREKTGDKSFNLKEYRKQKAAERAAFVKGNVKLNVEYNGQPVLKYAREKSLKIIASYLGWGILVFTVLNKLLQVVRGLFKPALQLV